MTLTLVADLLQLTRVWRGDVDWVRAERQRTVQVLGSPRARAALPRLLPPTRLARVPRPAADAARHDRRRSG